MFTYWRKRGAYELEPLPSSLTQLGMDRFWWSSSLEVIYDVYDEKAAQEEECVLCQHPECMDHRHATKGPVVVSIIGSPQVLPGCEVIALAIRL
ncbi:hypothetical protein E1301_Tti014018 [Triplophysa tibetana]|uniref:Uncharacterized protein n=1 Tax=Triplophysa tibetana TaxID=1572043 RepID=A0A5A9NC76_9TELE|nr:hypothetical protein E1301_Tti014018 [Triplophysa tibetana]